ncbi:YciI family protein [Flavivirga algicola]|uniref:YCII-related domain-containing protein n=1 Tax=Flavivirga algicola TaxID=2729136 RepID=A0ABX1RZP1_9FLAO|nr:YciI family protein [Flavivirga algicola]NMH89071.1 hypothetical protein [Flavivirga algicola]
MKNLMLCVLSLLFALNAFSQTDKQKNNENEFMFFVYSDGNRVADLPSEKQQIHIEKIGAYIHNLAQSGKLKGAQPLEMEGLLIEGKKGSFKTENLNKKGKIIAGYYHILAKDMHEAITIAKKDPRFEEDGWQIVVRPIKKITGIN